MRLFYAIACPESIRMQLDAYRQVAEMTAERGKWTLPENYHITLCFIGEVQSHSREAYERILETAAQNTSSFGVCISGFGTFQKKNRCVVWAGVRTEACGVQLSRYFHDVVFPHSASEPWVPHLTLGRECVLAGVPEAAGLPELRWEVSEIHLMESLRLDGVLTYRPVKSAVLVG